MFFDRDFFGTPVNLLLSSQKSQGVPFFPICHKTPSAAAPSVLTPFVRDQEAASSSSSVLASLRLWVERLDRRHDAAHELSCASLGGTMQLSSSPNRRTTTKAHQLLPSPFGKLADEALQTSRPAERAFRNPGVQVSSLRSPDRRRDARGSSVESWLDSRE